MSTEKLPVNTGNIWLGNGIKMSLKLSVCPVGWLVSRVGIVDLRFLTIMNVLLEWFTKQKSWMSNGFFQEISKIINKAGKVSNIFRTIKYLEIRQLQNLSFLTKKFLSKIFIKNKICFVLKVLECTNIFDIGIAAYIDPRVLLERYSGSSRIL